MKKLVMPKGDGTLEALNNSLSIYYSNRYEWVENEKFRVEIHKRLNFTEEKDGPFLIKKSEIAKYFNLVEYKSKERIGKITDRGIRYFESKTSEEKKDIIMESILNDSFGRNNNVVPSSNSKVDPPKLLLKAIYELDYITTKEFELMINYVHNLGWKFEQVIKEMYSVRCGNKPKEQVDKENYYKYSDIKFKTFFVNLGILKKEKNNYYLSNYIYQNYSNYIEELCIYNSLDESNYLDLLDSERIKENEDSNDIVGDEYINTKAIEIQNNRKPEVIYSNGLKFKYKLNRRLKKTALKIQGYMCCINNEHVTFVDKEDKPYMEGHHLIPMSAQKDFPNINLDRVENIVSLCPICHRGVHYGNNSFRKQILLKLYESRKDELIECGIVIGFDELYSKYYI